MPIYEYACNHCGHVFDALQKMSDDPLTTCPECGQEQLKKLLSAPNFRLKGGGWYETDFKKDSDKRRNLAGDAKTKTAADAPGKADGKSDQKATPDKKETKPAGKAADA